MPVAKIPGVTVSAFLDAKGIEALDEPLTPFQEMLRKVQANLLADEGRAIADLVRNTPGDERGIEVTRSSHMDGEVMRFRTTVARTETVPAGTISYRYEYDEPRGN